MRPGPTSFPLEQLTDEEDGATCSPRGGGVQLHLECDLGGFKLRLPVLGNEGGKAAAGRQGHGHGHHHRHGHHQHRHHKHGGAGASPALLARAGQAAAAEVLELQRLLVERDRSLLGRLAAAGEPADVHFFTRWLISRKWDVEHAARDIAAHAAWREDFMPAGAVAAALEASAAGGQRKVFLQGRDRQGQAVVVVKAGKGVLSGRDIDTTKRLICSALDRAAAAANPALNPLGRVLCVFDLSGLSVRELDSRALREIFDVLQRHYPERLARLFFLNTPFVFWGVWQVVSPFLDAKTVQKIKFAKGRGIAAALLELVPEGVLPAEYGGTAALVPLEEAVAASQAAAAAAAAAGGGGQGAGSGEGAEAGRWGWRARLAGARQAVGDGLRGAARAVQRAAQAVGEAVSCAANAMGEAAGRAAQAATAAGSAVQRVAQGPKSTDTGARRLLRQLLMPQLLLTVLLKAGRALKWVGQSAQRRIRRE